MGHFERFMKCALTRGRGDYNQPKAVEADDTHTDCRFMQLEVSCSVVSKMPSNLTVKWIQIYTCYYISVFVYNSLDPAYLSILAESITDQIWSLA